MDKKINEEFICVLVKNQQSNRVSLDFLPIINPLKGKIDKLKKLCYDSNSTLQDIISFIRHTPELNELTGHYNYCKYLNKPYQRVTANHQEIINVIIERQKLLLLNQEQNPKNFDLDGKINEFKAELAETYNLWGNAFAITKMYKICNDDPRILTFSHRLSGFSNPIYQLTPNLSIEIKTNFGFGNASYFYTKLKYKNIEITPFSDWINYEFAQFSEIIRYTRTHILQNSKWLEAMKFTKEASNLSMENEITFVEKYIVDECEKMVIGLENLFRNTPIQCKNKYSKEIYSIDKKGHTLMEFKGEKISGALDFISKILEFDKIVSIQNFVLRIINCNKIIQPLLVTELDEIRQKITVLNFQLEKIKSEYNLLNAINQKYLTLKSELQYELIATKNFDKEIFNRDLAIKFPEIEKFLVKFNIVSDKYNSLNKQIANLETIFNKITFYNNKILMFLSSQKESKIFV